MGIVQEFKEFAIKGNMVDLAVGVIIGGAFGKIVDSLVKDIIMPIIGVITGGIDFSNLFVQLAGEPQATLDKAREAGATLAYGNFVTIVINFLIIAWVVFMLVKGVNKVKDAAMREEEAAPEAPAAPAGPTQEDLLAEIRDLLKAR